MKRSTAALPQKKRFSCEIPMKRPLFKHTGDNTAVFLNDKGGGTSSPSLIHIPDCNSILMPSQSLF
mgnify:CR=1 FL=1